MFVIFVTVEVVMRKTLSEMDLLSISGRYLVGSEGFNVLLSLFWGFYDGIARKMRFLDLFAPILKLQV